MKDRLLSANVSEVLLKIRRKHEITQKEMAHSIGITQSALSKLELGKQMPRAETLSKLREVYNVNLNKILVQ